MQSTGRYDLVRALIRKQDLVFGPLRHSFNMHIVAVEVIQHERAVVSRGGGVRKTAGLIGEDLAGCRDALGEDCVGASAGGRGCGRFDGDWICGWRKWRG